MGSQIASKNAEMQCITCLDAVLPGTNELSRSVKTCSEKSRARILEERAKLERTSKALTDSSSSLSASKTRDNDSNDDDDDDDYGWVSG